MIVTTYYDHLQRNRRQTNRATPPSGARVWGTIIMILYVYHVLLQTYVAGRCLSGN